MLTRRGRAVKYQKDAVEDGRLLELAASMARDKARLLSNAFTDVRSRAVSVVGVGSPASLTCCWGGSCTLESFWRT